MLAVGIVITVTGPDKEYDLRVFAEQFAPELTTTRRLLDQMQAAIEGGVESFFPGGHRPVAPSHRGNRVTAGRP